MGEKEKQLLREKEAEKEAKKREIELAQRPYDELTDEQKALLSDTAKGKINRNAGFVKVYNRLGQEIWVTPIRRQEMKDSGELG